MAPPVPAATFLPPPALALSVASAQRARRLPRTACSALLALARKGTDQKAGWCAASSADRSLPSPVCLPDYTARTGPRGAQRAAAVVRALPGLASSAGRGIGDI